jgi:hypothetical protein
VLASVEPVVAGDTASHSLARFVDARRYARLESVRNGRDAGSELMPRDGGKRRIYRLAAYMLSVSKAGYLKIEYGQKASLSSVARRWTCDPASCLTRSTSPLPPAGAITGRVFDEFGDPAATVFVRALRPEVRRWTT